LSRANIAHAFNALLTIKTQVEEAGLMVSRMATEMLIFTSVAVRRYR